jgi:quercetin 2,3-dioxygenase
VLRVRGLRLHQRLQLSAPVPRRARLLLLGGIPVTEKIVMWWNVIARTGEEGEEIASAQERWQAELAGEPSPVAAAGAGSFRSGPFGAVPARSVRRRAGL